MKTLSFYITFIIPIIAYASNEYVLPGLCISRESPTCQNVDRLLRDIDHDKVYLLELISKINNHIRTIQEGQDRAVEECQLSGPSFSEQKNPTYLKNKKRLGYSFDKWSVDPPGKDCEVDQVIQQRGNEIFLIATKGKVFDHEGMEGTNICDSIPKIADDNIEYLTWLKKQVDDTIGSFLLDRVIALTDRKATCVLTQTDIVTLNLSDSTLAKEDKGERLIEHEVKFKKPFTTVPDVGVAIVGFDIQNNGMALFANPKDITTEGFTLQVTAKSNIKVYEAQVSWLATLSKYSGLKILTTTIDTCQENKALCKGRGYRMYEAEVPLNAPCPNCDLALFLNGFYFEQGSDPRLEINGFIDEKRLLIAQSTWEDTSVRAVSVTAIMYDRSKTRITKTEFKNSKLSEVSLFSNTVKQVQADDLELGNFKTLPLVFPGIQGLELSRLHNYRLELQNYVIQGASKRSLKVLYKTWSYSRVYLAAHGYLVFCGNTDCI